MYAWVSSPGSGHICGFEQERECEEGISHCCLPPLLQASSALAGDACDKAELQCNYLHKTSKE